jgi:hypothetical protein
VKNTHGLDIVSVVNTPGDDGILVARLASLDAEHAAAAAKQWKGSVVSHVALDLAQVAREATHPYGPIERLALELHNARNLSREALLLLEHYATKLGEMDVNVKSLRALVDLQLIGPQPPVGHYEITDAGVEVLLENGLRTS